MHIEEIKSLFLKYKETNLFHRYITNKHIAPLLNRLGEGAVIETIGESVLSKPIYGIKIGKGNKRILMWSQMHGNESTTTKALFDLLNTFLDKNEYSENILNACTLYIIPILNPDGAEAYTRVNANKVDLNRDAQNLSQPESKVLRSIFEAFKPHFCYNLHGQRTIFSAGKTNKPATVSFLAPAQDEACTVTPNRKIAMAIIGVMNETLQKIIPKQVGVYDDAFNLNCVGDTFQNENIPTILFEAGHYENDYGREVTRELIYTSYISSLSYIANNSVTGSKYEAYFKIPENEKCFYDVIIRNARVAASHSNEKINDIAVQYQEKLIHGQIKLIPKIEKIEKLDAFYGHKEIDANGFEVFGVDNQLVAIDYENVFVIINNDKIAL
ncbi:M14 metallopeptidase family protein [Flavivirga sp. 57AJ16]|uniref:M14 family metallopeptidase n=1 Tax=Flavivirga sp. 57AJ16 TaxID=3025307 RepID=UPI0023653EE8|nr:M14 metallopeptidase family protein [Flavivirga sp. 57AJ16]MDD7885852.1 M14 family metallopeptidase [Flavivirga sp. 57AJ16]